MGDEKLRAIGAWAGVRHTQAPRPIVTKLRGEFIGESIPGAARARALGATALDHKVADYAVKCETVIESFQPQIDEIGSGYWRRLGMQVDINCALRSRERGSYVGHGYLSRLFAKGAP